MEQDKLESRVGKLLRECGWRLAVAESCTGGLISHRLTNVPGSSTYYVGGLVTYAYEAKVRMLGVRWETLEAHGAVSEEVVLEMARGAKKAMGADVGLAVSGIAGPGGGTPEKPVGTTWIGLSLPDEDLARRYQWEGDRLQVKEQSAQEALRLLSSQLERLLEERGAGPEAGGEAAGRSGQMDRVEVNARFDANGHVRPVSLQVDGQTIPVDSTGRRWQADDGLHILTMLPGGRVVELVFRAQEMKWYLRSLGPHRRVA